MFLFFMMFVNFKKNEGSKLKSAGKKWNFWKFNDMGCSRVIQNLL